MSEAVNLLCALTIGHHVRVSAYCFMPEHLHLLLFVEENGNLMTFMHGFKQQSASAANRWLRLRGRFWQRSYYDHVLRNEGTMADVARYVRENPVRRGLVAEVGDYPFAGRLGLKDGVAYVLPPEM